MASRPKQRVLIRWNDDLDKSLLLFITHTCTELGIKIPYDIVAQRMGSTFSEGAIQQHIAKLRTKMAELNVAPVPGPPKRGTVTNKPSSIYTQKSRAAPPPPPPPPTTAKSRSHTVGRSTQPDGDDEYGASHKARPRRRAATRKIKRSESDNGDSNDEFAGHDNEDFEPEPVSGTNKRKQAGARGGRANASKRVRSSLAASLSKTNTIMEQLAKADQLYDAQYGNNSSYQYDEAPPTYQLQNSIEHAGGPAADAYSGYPGSMLAAGYGEEEEEEREAPLDIQNQSVQYTNSTVPFRFTQEEQVSPTTTNDMGSMAVMPSSFPLVDGTSPAALKFSGAPFQIPQDASFAPNIQDNFDFHSFNSFSMPPLEVSTAPTYSNMGPPSVYPSAMQFNVPDYVESSPSTRNTSFVSRSSSQGNLYGQPPTPSHHARFDSAMHDQASPADGFFDIGNMSMSSPGFTQNIEGWEHVNSDGDNDFSQLWGAVDAGLLGGNQAVGQQGRQL